MNSDGKIAPKEKECLLVAVIVQKEAWNTPQVSFLMSPACAGSNGFPTFDLLQYTTEDRETKSPAFSKNLPPSHVSFLEKLHVSAADVTPLVATLPEDYVSVNPTKVVSAINIFLTQKKILPAAKETLEADLQNQPLVYGVPHLRFVPAEEAYASLKEGHLSSDVGLALASYKTVFLQSMYESVINELSCRSYFMHGPNGTFRYDRAAIAAKSKHASIPGWALS